MHLNLKAALKLSLLKKKKKKFVIGLIIVKVYIKFFEKVIGKFFANLLRSLLPGWSPQN